jgi:hypothetical protein
LDPGVYLMTVSAYSPSTNGTTYGYYHLIDYYTGAYIATGGDGMCYQYTPYAAWVTKSSIFFVDDKVKFSRYASNSYSGSYNFVIAKILRLTPKGYWS